MYSGLFSIKKQTKACYSQQNNIDSINAVDMRDTFFLILNTF